VGIGSESDCLLGLLNKILETSYSEVRLKTEKSGGATGGEGEFGEVEEELLASERRSLDILSLKKEAKRSAIEVAADEEGKGEADLRFYCPNYPSVFSGQPRLQFGGGRSNAPVTTILRCLTWLHPTAPEWASP